MNFTKVYWGLGLLMFMGLEAPAALEAPSDLLAKEYPPANMRFVLSIKDDLLRSVCRVDAALMSELRRELRVSTNTTITSLLTSIGMTNWTGGKQVRIIKKNAILQSEYPKPGASNDQLQQFRKTRVEPADIIVICPND